MGSVGLNDEFAVELDAEIWIFNDDFEDVQVELSLVADGQLSIAVPCQTNIPEVDYFRICIDERADAPAREGNLDRFVIRVVATDGYSVFVVYSQNR